MSWIRRAGGSGLTTGSLFGILASAFLWRGQFVEASVFLIAGLAFALPPLLIALRFRLLTEINGEEGIQLPNESLGVTDEVFKQVYNHKAAHGRSKQSQYGLSDFFWYLLAPAHAIHQEHIESSDIRYKIVSAVTRKLCSVPEEQLEAIATAHAKELFSPKRLSGEGWEAKRFWGGWDRGWLLGRGRDLFFPLFERMIFELVFGQGEGTLPDDENEICTASAENVLNSIKGVAMRKVEKRRELCDYLLKKLDGGALGDVLDPQIENEEWALFLQGVFFTTGVVQMSEAMTHLSLALAQHPAVLTKLREAEAKGDGTYLGHVITETLRVWPLFGIAHRITSEDIEVPTKDGSKAVTLPKGSVLCFNYPRYHMSGYDNPAQFTPERWEVLRERNCNYMPFGPPNNRPCPGKRISLIWMRAVTRVMLTQVEVFSCTEHTRSLPCGGPMLIVPRQATDAPESTQTIPSQLKGKPQTRALSLVAVACFMAAMRIWLAAESIWRPVLQAYNEVLMLRESKKVKLAQKYFLHDYKNAELSDPRKPCLSNQLYRPHK